MNDIITEINQELRQDRSKALWNKYGIYVIAAVVAIVVVVAGRQAYVGYETSARENAANSYLSAVEAETPALLDQIAAEQGEGYAMLAKFTNAARLAEAGDDGAEAAYLAIANDAIQLAQMMLSFNNAIANFRQRNPEFFCSKVAI